MKYDQQELAAICTFSCLNVAGDLLLFTPAPSLRNEKKIQIVHIDESERKKAAQIDHSLAIVKDRCLDCQPKEDIIEQSEKFKNSNEYPVERTWSYKVSHTEGTEQARVKSSGWSLGAELAPSANVPGVGGISLGKLFGTYHRSKQETSSTSELKSVQRNHDKQFTIPAESSVIVKHLQVTKTFKCKIENIKVSFNPKTKIKCKVKKVNDTSEKTMDKQCKLHEAFYLNDEAIPDTASRSEILQRTVSACYTWNEIYTDIRVERVSN